MIFVSEALTLAVNYDLSRAEAMELARFAWVHPEINDQNFPPEGGGTRSVSLRLLCFKFGKRMTIEKALETFDREGYRPATITELLAFGFAHPALKDDMPSVPSGRTRMMVVSFYNSAGKNPGAGTSGNCTSTRFGQGTHL